ncbi:hypothetical protein VPH35_035363 [Triticum aestivum]
MDWVVDHWHKGCITKAADIRMPNMFSLDQVSLVLKLGLLCSHPVPNARPTMRQVLQYLDGDVLLPDLSATYLTSTKLEQMYNSEFVNQNVMSYMSSSSMSVVSDLSRGR